MKRIIFVFLVALIVFSACARVERVEKTPVQSEEAESAEIEGELNAMISEIDNVDRELDLTQDFGQEIVLG